MTSPTAPAAEEPGSDAPSGEPDEFAPLLRALIKARGVSLEQLRLALAALGSKVSVATLSYWRTGRSRPDRGDSLVALARLEQILEVPAGFLISRTTPRGPGRAAAATLPSYYFGGREAGTLVDQAAPRVAEEAIAHLGLQLDTGLRRVSIHERVTIRADGTAAPLEVRLVCVAERDGADRFPIWYLREDPLGVPFVLPVSGCRLGHVREFCGPRSVAAEMVLDRPLALGEACIVDYRLETVGQTCRMESQLRAVTAPLRELVIEVAFTGDRLPAQIFRRTVHDGEVVREPISLTSPFVSLLLEDPELGISGLEWTW